LIGVIALIAMSGKEEAGDSSAVPASPAPVAEHKPAASPPNVEKPAEPPAVATANPVVRPIAAEPAPSAEPKPVVAPAPSAVLPKKPATASTAAPAPRPVPKKPKKVDLGY
jgi:hypothetical protein